MRDDPHAIGPIETDEPTRSDELIELARHSRRGRFSLRHLFVLLLFFSVALGLLRLTGVFDRWQHYYWLAVGGGYFFAPMISLCLAAWFWPKPRGHLQLALGGSLVLTLVYYWSMLMANARLGELIASAVFGLILWVLQVGCLMTVQWSLFRDRLPRRRLPKQLPKAQGKLESAENSCEC